MNERRSSAWVIGGAWVVLAGCTGLPRPPESGETDPKPYDDEVAAPTIVREVETPEGRTVVIDALPDDEAVVN